MRHVMSQPYRAIRFAALIGILAATGVSGETARTIQWRKIGNTPGFPGLHQELQRIVARHKQSTATFCVVLRDSGDHDPIAYALWPRQHLLYRWQATRDAAIGDATLLHHIPLDLRKDIVRSPVDRLSTYKVTSSWVRDVETQCREHGEQISVRRGSQ